MFKKLRLIEHTTISHYLAVIPHPILYWMLLLSKIVKIVRNHNESSFDDAWYLKGFICIYT